MYKGGNVFPITLISWRKLRKLSGAGICDGAVCFVLKLCLLCSNYVCMYLCCIVVQFVRFLTKMNFWAVGILGTSQCSFFWGCCSHFWQYSKIEMSITGCLSDIFSSNNRYNGTRAHLTIWRLDWDLCAGSVHAYFSSLHWFAAQECREFQFSYMSTKGKGVCESI